MDHNHSKYNDSLTSQIVKKRKRQYKQNKHSNKPSTESQCPGYE